MMEKLRKSALLLCLFSFIAVFVSCDKDDDGDLNSYEVTAVLTDPGDLSATAAEFMRTELGKISSGIIICTEAQAIAAFDKAIQVATFPSTMVGITKNVVITIKLTNVTNSSLVKTKVYTIQPQ